MRNKKILLFAAIVLSGILGLGGSLPALAAEMSDEADTEEQYKEQNGYITISVDAEDDNGELMYAIDSDAPEAFGESNVFEIDPTLPHTVYVKDAAGNVTSQSFEPLGVEYQGEGSQKDDLVSSADSSDSEPAAPEDAAEAGGGTVYDKAVTDGTDDFSRVFYTLTTKEGEVFYLVIDQNRGQDNVYLLNMVTVDDLQALAGENGYILSERRSEGSMTASEEETIEDLTGDRPTGGKTKKEGPKTNVTSTIVIVVTAGIGGGIYYYLKVHKKKKDAAMDEIDHALDMDAFVSDADEDEEDEIDMPVDDRTISDEEFYGMYDEEESAYLDADPDDGEEEGDI
ncbi:MAG: DUF4366 domain-containing protein [Clostridium sp.]|nr:DUF4366 domain-containing protein [Clostridium sp.]